MQNNAKTWYGAVALLLTIIMIVVIWHTLRWQVIVAYFVALNSVTMMYYLWDKMIAPTHIVRVPEVVLHLLALFGGSPAALLGQKLFRHKTQKTTFRMWFWLIVLVQGVGVLYLLYKANRF